MHVCDHKYMCIWNLTMELKLHGLQPRPKDPTTLWGTERKQRATARCDNGKRQLCCCCGWKSCSFPIGSKQAYCHGEPSCFHATVKFVCTECSPTDTSEITVAQGVNSLTPGKEFTVHNPTNVKENHQNVLGCAPDLTRVNEGDRILKYLINIWWSKLSKAWVND